MADPYWEDNEEPELAITLEEYNDFDDVAHAARLCWRTTNDDDYKPALVHGRRTTPGSSVRHDPGDEQ